MKNKTHEHKNTDSEIEKKELYELDKMNLGDNYKELRKRAF